MDLRRRISTLFTALLLVFSGTLCAQPFPSKPIRFIVPYPPGGTIDVMARAIAPEMSVLWNQPVVVENIGGAGSVIGTERAAAAPPDGHTLLLTVNPTVVGNRFLFKKLPYDPDKSIVPVTMLAQGGQFIFAHPAFPANTLRELVELARREPGKIPYASFGNGSQPQLLFETIGKRENVRLLHVPYKGIAQATTAVVAGEVQLCVASAAQAGALIKAGKLKALAVASERRATGFTDIPTVAEAGYPYALASVWLGVFAPGGMTPALIDRLQRDFASVARRPDFVERHITGRGFELVANTPAAFAAAIRAETELAGEMVRAANIQAE